MGLETATLIHELDPANPVGASDPKSQGDNHLRLIKACIQNTFANVDGAVTASHTEMNKLAGLTATTAELNKLTGTAAGLTAAELSVLDGLTATTAELNKLAGTAAGLTAAELSVLDGITATTAELNKLAGVAAGLTAAELSFVDGVTSNIQTQLNAITALLANLISGTYTPTISGTSNLDSTTPQVCRYIRVGNFVMVSGQITVDPAAAALTFMNVSLPIASNLTGGNTVLSGICTVNRGPPAVFGRIVGVDASDNAQFVWLDTGSSSTALNFDFTYQIN
jgi:hypothetical protein